MYRWARGMAERVIRNIAIPGFLGSAACIGLFVILWAEHTLIVTLPSPTGSRAVGREILDWVDDKTVDVLAPVPGTKRELLVWIWYPAEPGTGSVTDDYMPRPMRATVDRASGVLIGKFLTRDLSKVRGHSLRDADISTQLRSLIPW